MNLIRRSRERHAIAGKRRIGCWMNDLAGEVSTHRPTPGGRLWTSAEDPPLGMAADAEVAEGSAARRRRWVGGG